MPKSDLRVDRHFVKPFFLFFVLFFCFLPLKSPVFASIGFTELGSFIDDIPQTATSAYGYKLGIGNFNGDSYNDLIITAPYYPSNTKGRLYIYYGGPSLNTDADITIDGEATADRFSSDYNSNIGIGDLDNDQITDLVLGAALNDQAGTNYGKSYIFFGSGLTTGPHLAANADLSILGNSTTKKGFGSSSIIGDFNGDGNNDMAIGAYKSDNQGAIYIYYGNGTKQLDLTEDVILTVSGSLLLGVYENTLKTGDINGDGYDDIIAGDYYATKGKIYVFYGGPSMDSTPDVLFTAEAPTDNFSREAVDIKDINKDGYDDICMGAMKNNSPSSKAGRVYCIFGSATFSGAKPVANDSIIFNGASANDDFGRAVFLYDVNNDGNIDLIVGASQDYGSTNGYVQIYLGNGTTIDTTADVTITAADIGESLKHFGSQVLAGDFDNDGWQDIFVTSFFGGNTTNPALLVGRVHLFEINYGSPVITPVTLTTNDTTPTLTGTATESGINLKGVQWSATNTINGTWTGCTASDGAYDSTSESFSCDISTPQSEGAHTFYLRTYDANDVYMSPDLYQSTIVTIDTTASTLALTPVTDPTTDTTPTLSGTAADATGTISAVQYQMDSTSGSWAACTANDGAFDEISEAFTCTSPALSIGTHTMHVRATDNSSNTTTVSDEFTIQTQAQASEEGTPNLAPSGVSEPNNSDTAVLGAKTITSADEVEVSWDRPADTSNIDHYTVYYREIGESDWESEEVDHDADSITFDPGEGKYEWYLEITYTDGSTSATDIYKFEIDQTDPIIPKETISLMDEIPGTTIYLPYGSPLVVNTEDPDGDKIIEIWDWDKTIHYDTMVCGSGACDRGHLLTGNLTLVIYMEDEVGNMSEEREIKVSPFGATASYVPAALPESSVPPVQGASITETLPTSTSSTETTPEVKPEATAPSAAEPAPTPQTPPHQNILQRIWHKIFK